MYEPAFYVDAATVAAAAAPAADATAVAAAMLLLLLTAVCAEAVLHVSLLNTIVRSIVYNMEQIFNVYNKSPRVHGDLSTDHYSYNTQQ